MAETVLSDVDLARIVRDLDELVMPAPETVRALVAETRRLRGLEVTVHRYSVVLARIAHLVEQAAREDAGVAPWLAS